jgi:hypothetical protein
MREWRSEDDNMVAVFAASLFGILPLYTPIVTGILIGAPLNYSYLVTGGIQSLKE